MRKLYLSVLLCLVISLSQGMAMAQGEKVARVVDGMLAEGFQTAIALEKDTNTVVNIANNQRMTLPDIASLNTDQLVGNVGGYEIYMNVPPKIAAVHVENKVSNLAGGSKLLYLTTDPNEGMVIYVLKDFVKTMGNTLKKDANFKKNYQKIKDEEVKQNYLASNVLYSVHHLNRIESLQRFKQVRWGICYLDNTIGLLESYGVVGEGIKELPLKSGDNNSLKDLKLSLIIGDDLVTVDMLFLANNSEAYEQALGGLLSLKVKKAV